MAFVASEADTSSQSRGRVMSMAWPAGSNERGRRYTTTEVARAVGCHIRTVQRALIAGRLKGWKTGRGHYWKVGEQALKEWLASMASGLGDEQ